MNDNPATDEELSQTWVKLRDELSLIKQKLNPKQNNVYKDINTVIANVSKKIKTTVFDFLLGRYTNDIKYIFKERIKNYNLHSEIYNSQLYEIEKLSVGKL